MAQDMGIEQRIDRMVKGHPVVLFMKGTRSGPQCGFSARVVSILDELLPEYETVDVLADPEVREGVKRYSDWPTIPQLFVQGEFVGGCDIVEGMSASGELNELLGVELAPVEPPMVTLTPAALEVIAEAAKDCGEGEHLRIKVGPHFDYDMGFGPRQRGDLAVETGGILVLFDRQSARRANGMRLDYKKEFGGGGFTIDNPNEPPHVVQLTPGDLQAMRARGEAFELFDVRTRDEREIACIEGARHLDETGRAYLEALPKDTLVVFHCHHGGRSQAAAEHYLRAGFKRAHNLAGGIDAWSTQVDPEIARY